MQDNFADRELDRQNYTSAIFRARFSKNTSGITLSKTAKVLLLILAALIVAFFVVRACSLPLTMMLNGFDTKAEHTFAPTGSVGTSDNAFTVLHTTTSNGEHALVHLQKSELGFWKVVQSAVLTEEYAYRTLTWFTPGSSQSVRIEISEDDVVSEPLSVTTEKHAVFIGNNAINKITVSQNKLPEGYYFRIYQNDSFYIIEAITQSDEFNSSMIYDAFRYCLRPEN